MDAVMRCIRAVTAWCRTRLKGKGAAQHAPATKRSLLSNKTMGKETVVIDCGDAKHRISLMKGRLVLHDHPNISAERALIALGGKECECLKILQAWKEAWRHERFYLLPLEFRRLRDRIRNEPRIQKRYARKNEPSKDEFDRPLWLRANERLRRIVLAEILKCKYRKGVQHTVRIEIFDATDDRGSFIRGKAWEGKTLNKQTRYDEWIIVVNSYIDVRILLRWYSRVYKRGLAVVDGCFVVDAIEDPQLGTVVLAGRQDPDDGYNIRPVAARIVNGGLEWLS